MYFDTFGYPDEDVTGMQPSNALSTAIRKYLIAQKKARYEGGRKAGRIDKRRAWRASAMAGSPSSMYIRKQPSVKNMLDSAVSVVVDMSGSMSGDKYRHAAHSAIMLNETLAKIGVPTEVIAFTDDRQVINVVHKEFSSSIDNDDLAKQFKIASQWMGGNSDGESIMWCAERLLARKEKKKIMIVLSDGYPSGSGHGDIRSYTKKVIQTLEKIVDVHGIGIQSNAVTDYYSSNSVINDSSQLENELLSVLKNRVLS